MYSILIQLDERLDDLKAKNEATRTAKVNSLKMQV
jgi:hypothetical protein